MRLIVEFEGAVVDLAPGYHVIHCQVADEVGWSRLDARTFWRLTRKGGADANVLPAAKPIKLADYRARYATAIEADAAIEQLVPHSEAGAALTLLSSHGPCTMVTLGSNLAARQRVLDDAGYARHFLQAVALDPDPRRRPGELRLLAEKDKRTVLVATSDGLIRAGGQAELFTVGLTCGACTAERLFQAGACIVIRDLNALTEALAGGGEELVRAGLLPPSLDA